MTKPFGSVEFHIDGEDQKLFSPSYEQVGKYLSEGKPNEQLGDYYYEDYAYITKVSNANQICENGKLFIISGIRGIGTWGAGELFRKYEYWKSLYRELEKF